VGSKEKWAKEMEGGGVIIYGDDTSVFELLYFCSKQTWCLTSTATISLGGSVLVL